MDGSWLQLKLKRRRLQRRLHAHLTLLHVYYPWNQIKSILLLNIRITKQTNPNAPHLTLTLLDTGCVLTASTWGEGYLTLTG